ncbi:MAG: CpsD/CapB family tyrosine-protein kinase [Sphingomonadales bacterium]|nr:CpsD/CapB family tyrosine-protein kinase [Sphingomonadales bacterium]
MNATTLGNGASLHIPSVADLQVYQPEAETLENHFIVGFDSRDVRARPFNLVRTQVAKRLASRGARIVGITSATPDAGKSFFSLNLAASLSRVAEQTVYLVDLDLRRGSIATELGMTPKLGVSDFLDGTTDDLGSLGWRVDNSDLAVFPTRSIRGNSAELMASERFAQLVESFRSLPDNAIVLCDMPPAFANDDTMIAMQKLDGFFMVIDSGRTTKRQVRDTMEMLQPAPCFGAVMNRYKGALMDSYGYGYGYGSKMYDAYYN